MFPDRYFAARYFPNRFFPLGSGTSSSGGYRVVRRFLHVMRI